MDNKDSGIDLTFDDKYRDIRDKFAEKFFNGSSVDTCIFAFSLGISKESRINKDRWSSKGQTSWSDMNRLRGKGINFEILLDYMGLTEEGIPAARIISEYVTGGLQIIDDELMLEDGGFGELESYLNAQMPLSE